MGTKVNLNISVKGASNLIIKRFTGPFWKYRMWLNKTQWFEREQFEQIQLSLLQSLVRHCYQTVPYYHKLMDELEIKPGDIKKPEDLSFFPLLTKKDVLEAGEQLVSTKYPKWFVRTAYTGGTTGTPLPLRRDLFSIGREHAFVRRQWDWAGIGLNDRCAYLSGRVIIKPDKINGRLYAYDPFMKELILSTYHLSPDKAREYAEVMKLYKVKAIAGYPSAISLLAKSCLDAGIDLKLQAALTSSETLTPSMRKTIEEAFGCGVYDFYGSAERSCYIFTCEQGCYHLIPEYGLTELIPLDNSNASRCKVVSTGFWNFAMPLIRYELGDVIVKSGKKCSCKRCMPVIESIEGRQADVIKTASNRHFGAAILTHLLYGTGNIVESQIIQDTIDHIDIEYVPGTNFSKDDLDALKRLIAQHLPSELKVDLKKVGAVARTSSGKIRPVVSKIA
jgi:phenylacetate-CoA ligase